MLNFIKKIFSSESADPEAGASYDYDKKIQVATCALFIQTAQADDNFSEIERESIIKIMQNKFRLSEDEINDLMELSEEKVKESISIYEFASLINEHYSVEEKFELLKNLWRIIYTDSTLDKYEDKMIKMIGGVLNMERQQIIGAKLLVQEENIKK